MFIEVTAINTGNKYILPKASIYIKVLTYGRNTTDVVVGCINTQIEVDVKETYEEIKALLGLGD